MARRVEGLDEKIRLKSSGCEELVRQRTRELEQQLHAQQQKVHLAVSTSEEMLKRQTAKLRKMGQTSEEQSRKLATLEELVKRPQDNASMASAMRLEARLSELEGQQASLEEEFRSLAASQVTMGASSTSGLREGSGEAARGSSAGGRDDPDNYDSIRAVERELSILSDRISTQLDEHSASLANLRVRTESQEQRLTAAGERLETVLAPPLEALRAEIRENRESDRNELEMQLERLTRQIQNAAEASEEAIAEVRAQCSQAADDALSSSRRGEGQPFELQRLAETCAMQEQQLRRLEASLDREPQGQGLLIRLEGLEQKIEYLEEDGGSQELLSQKADRAELMRLDASLREFSEPLRRLSQRTASSETRSTALERRIEQLQDALNSSATRSGGSGSAAESHPSPEDGGAPLNGGMEALARQLAELSARVIDMESHLENSQSAGDGAELLDSRDRERAAFNEVSREVAGLREAVKDMKVELKTVSEQSDEATSATLQKDLEGMRQEMQKLGSKAEASVTLAATEAATVASDVKKSISSLQNVTSGLQSRLQEEQSARETLRTDLQQLTERLEDKKDSSANNGEDVVLEVQELAKRLKSEMADLSDRAGEALQLAQAGDVVSKDLRSELHEHAKKTQELEVDMVKKAVASVKEDDFFQALRRELEAEKASRADLAERFEKLATKTANELEVGSAASSASQSIDDEAKAREAVKKVLSTQTSIDALAATIEELEKRLEARMEASEAASKAVREELMGASSQDPTAGRALELARACEGEVKDLQSTLKAKQDSLVALTTRIQLMDSKIEALEKAGPASRSRSTESATPLPGQPVPDMSRMEAKVEDLRRQVAEELEQLTEHQSLIAKAGLGKPGAAKSNSQEVERHVERLAEQVSQELRELKSHQGELSKVKATLLAGAPGGKVADFASDVDPKIVELQRQVEAELQALTKQQDGLGRAKVSIDDCKKGIAALEKRVDQLSVGKAATGVSDTSGLVKLTSALKGPVATSKALVGSSSAARSSKAAGAAADSDSSESYGHDDFDESEASVGER
eukprot:TRINITY_DN36860_c0_g1_i1.p1 TRINITY_DN36860_c0_g1~~TRINITY_DN36860_c0_g1_i1.p1  ORF type:complete len:1205 (-),score=365.25 TRINITY_DN36860_c0_g1_i1:56-3199(-)